MKNLFLIIYWISAGMLLAQSHEPKGSISGNVTDRQTKSPLIGVNIFIKNHQIGTTTDMNGNYEIKNVPVGLMSVVFSYIGYESITKTDVNVKPDRAVELNIEMNETAVELQDVVVTNGYFSELENMPVSAVNFSAEEISRSPGTAGDVSRILYTLPSVAKVNDQKNSLLVRGGTAVENSFYLDNIEIPNINHFPVEGSSDGPIGIINPDFVNDINFHSGGFSPIFGDRLSSVMEISFREGSKSRFSPQLNMSMAGIGGSVEGFLGEKASYLLSVNKSYIDMIVNQIDKAAPLPKYGDVQWKLAYKPDANNRLTFLDVYSVDKIYMSREKAMETNENIFGSTDGTTNTSGINWQHIWSNVGYSNTSLAHTFINYDRKYSKTTTQQDFYSNTSKENIVRLRNINYLKFNESNSVEFGLDFSANITNFNTFYGKYEDVYGNTIPPLYTTNKMNGYKLGLFGVHHFYLFENLKLDYGGRLDYFTYNSAMNISPRATLTYQLEPKTSLSLSAGLFHQYIPNNILVQSEKFESLKTPASAHFIAGFNKNLGDATRLSVEVYYKDYYNFLINPEQPTIFLFDQVQLYGLFWSNQSLDDNGKANAKGIEVMLQKKLSEDFYGLISSSYSSSKHKDYSGKWHNRIYDNKFNFNIEGGYIPNKEWEFKVRWVYAGGAPYTPYDYQASKSAGVGIWDLGRTNAERMPDYHSLNLRIDKRFYFETASLLVYFSVWNAYGRKNVALYYWNEVTNELNAQKQWGALQVLGLEYEF